MLKKIGLSSRFAFCKASLDHGYQSTGFSACCRRYGLVSIASLFGLEIRCLPAPSSCITGKCSCILYRLYMVDTILMFLRVLLSHGLFLMEAPQMDIAAL